MISPKGMQDTKLKKPIWNTFSKNGLASGRLRNYNK
jgi:hypothetical protein